MKFEKIIVELKINAFEIWIKKIVGITKKIVEAPGIEPGAFRMQSERDTTTPRARRNTGRRVVLMMWARV